MLTNGMGAVLSLGGGVSGSTPSPYPIIEDYTDSICL